jgi:two-component system chemotaxis sensor kinase CheA
MDDLSQFRNTYITECFELLAQMEELLLALDAKTDSEALNAIFRCAHSIKGGAGAFGLSKIAAFSHILEALLDKLRDRELEATPELVDILLQSKDVLNTMVQYAQSGKDEAPEQAEVITVKLKAAIQPSGAQTSESATPTNVVHAVQAETPKEAAKTEQDWQIIFKPKAEILFSGNEPLRILRELCGLGDARVKCHSEALSAITELNPEKCLLWWEIALSTDASEADIKEVFEFVEDEAEIVIRCTSQIQNVVVQKDTETHYAGTVSHVASSEPTAADAPKIFGRRHDDEKGDAKTAAATSIRVDIDKIDKLINMVGEMVIVQSMLAMQSRTLPVQQCAGMIQGIQELSQQTRELQEAVMAVRMQPVKSIFARMPRVVRDISAKLGKQVVLEMSGEHTEVDKTIIEQLSDPLTHMIRNSIDHGIEMPEERMATGKDAQGIIKLSAEHKSSNIVITVKDNGRGINRERVLAKAIERGIVAAQHNLTDTQIDYLVFAPGFSTAEKVTDVSGRGVGMDVVKRNIEAIGGQVMLANTPHKGMEITIILPLTLAILDGMVVRVGAENYIIPINHIAETLRPKASTIRYLPSGDMVMQVRGAMIPVLPLARYFSIESAEMDPTKALVVLVEQQGKHVGLVVDELIGQQQVVIKTLNQHTSHIHGVAGATILGDGRVSLILDVGAFADATMLSSRNESIIAEAA